MDYYLEIANVKACPYQNYGNILSKSNKQINSHISMRNIHNLH